MKNSCNPGCNSSERYVAVPLAEFTRMVRENERYRLAKEVFERHETLYDLNEALEPILGSTSAEKRRKTGEACKEGAE